MPDRHRSAIDIALLLVAVTSSLTLVVAIVLTLALQATMVWPLVAAVLLMASLTIWTSRNGMSGLTRPSRSEGR